MNFAARLWPPAGALVWNRQGRCAEQAEALLRRREPFCVSACSRYLSNPKNGKFWYGRPAGSENRAEKALPAKEGEGFILYTARSLFPVFDFEKGGLQNGKAFLPKELRGLLMGEGLHAAQGLTEDLEFLLPSLESLGIHVAQTIDYHLMKLDAAQAQEAIPGPAPRRPDPRWSIRPAERTDLDGLFPLQAEYEHEEVLPPGGVFYPAACRKNLEDLAARGLMLTAEAGGRLIGKININAESFTRFQIGGVYVDPAYRGQSIASAMTAELIRRFASKGKNWTLFVKKSNPAALRVYEKNGFTRLANYRIVYF